MTGDDNLELALKQESQLKKEATFKIMLNTFEELYDKKLDPKKVALWRKYLLTDRDYPEKNFIRVTELAGELKWFPKIAEVIERLDEYERYDQKYYKSLPEPTDHHKAIASKWMAQINTIISYGGKLREDFDDRLLGKLYEPEELKELLERNLKEKIN